MKTRISIVVLMMVFVQIVSTFAQEEKVRDQSLENIPEEYVVKKGDTLWDISEKFLLDPFRWPNIWEKNKYINNPHWIYPGQTLTLSPSEKPVVTPSLKPLEKPEPLFIQSAPRMSVAEPEERSVSPAPVLRPDTGEIIHKLENPRPVYTKKSFMRTGFITRRSELPKGKVVRLEDEMNSATKYDMIYIDEGTKEGVKEGDIFSVLTVGDRVKHPDNGKNLGVVVRVKGLLTVVSVGDEQSRCRITENFDPIAKNDLVMPVRLHSGPMFDAWVKPEVAIEGTILAINEPMFSIHIDDILYIDKGSEDGVLPGDRFVIYARKDKQSSTGYREPLGELEAINVMSTETAVTVVSLKEKHVKIGDCAQLTARCRLAE